jgi:hypothetical protein
VLSNIWFPWVWSCWMPSIHFVPAITMSPSSPIKVPPATCGVIPRMREKW